jgi:hypothetical protein
MQRLSLILHGTLQSCLRDAMQEGYADDIGACFHALRAFGAPPPPLLLMVGSTAVKLIEIQELVIRFI